MTLQKARELLDRLVIAPLADEHRATLARIQVAEHRHVVLTAPKGRKLVSSIPNCSISDSSCAWDRELDDGVLATLGFTDREREVTFAIGLGKSNAEISRELYMSVATVKAHVSRISKSSSSTTASRSR